MSVKGSISSRVIYGLDIGVASVGWAVIDNTHIIDLGVRCFDKAETAKEGEPLNLTRRTARLARRRLRRRAWRLTKLAKLLKRKNLIEDIAVMRSPPTKGFHTPNPWKLRVEALDKKLSSAAWASVIYHICKHRGFYWVSKAEAVAASGDKEAGRVKQGLSHTKRLMQGKHYRTAAEMVLSEFPEAQRNKQGEYNKALSRELLAEELQFLFAAQRNLGNTYADHDLERAILGDGDKKSGLFWQQKPSLSGEALLRMLGKCTFEKEEYRAPKASFSAERHVLLTRINNLRIIEDGKHRRLSEEERRIALYLPYQRATDLTYKQLGAALEKQGYLQKGEYKFSGLNYPKADDEKAKNPEMQTLVKIPAWHTLRKVLLDAKLDQAWQTISEDALNGYPELMDSIAWVLSVYKEDEEVERELAKLDLPDKVAVIKAFIGVRFDKFSNLSCVALRNIVPHMEQGLRYDEACEAAGYHHSLPDILRNKTKQTYLPSFYIGREKDGRLILNEDMDVPRNPVVLRALNQARKVVNALIRNYGAPHAVHIEMARDLSKPFDERKRIERDQLVYRERNKQARTTFMQIFGKEPKGRDFEKWLLYSEQQGKCAYSLNPLNINRLFEVGYVEIDHVLPYSRSFDDSKNNRVLVLTAENRNKGNQTPYEYLGGKQQSDRWHQFEAYVKANKSYRQAKRNRLLKKDFGEQEAKEFSERNLNDTRYICRFFKNYVEQYLQLHEESDVKRCVVVSGQLTSFLRFRWGLVKVRGDSDRHHALDAAVVAACSHSMVKRLSDYARRNEVEQAKGAVDITTGEIIDEAMLDKLEKDFPRPWAHFRDELLARLFTNHLDELRPIVESYATYPESTLKALRPLFVSRAPQRRNKGAAHKDTIYGQRPAFKEKGAATQRVAVEKLKLVDIDKLIDPHRNIKLYDALRQWVASKDDREKQARAIEAASGRGKDKRPLTSEEQTEIARLRALPRKPDKDGNPTGPIVRSVTMMVDKLSGVEVRGGVARNDTMIRVDVFQHVSSRKFFLVPVYVHHLVTGLPNKAIVQGKDQNEWVEMDENYTFLFSLYPNDLVRITFKNKPMRLGYYRSCHSGTGNINIALHDRYVMGEGTTSQRIHTKTPDKPIPSDKRGLIESIGVKTAVSIDKYHVDVLGHVYPAPVEQRHGLA